MISIDNEVMSLSAPELIAWAVRTFRRRFAVVTSFQSEGMVLADMALRADADARVITIDTGRLPAGTYEAIAAVESRYGTRVEIVRPDEGEAAAMVERFGPELFRASAAHRALCCEIRKVRPLARALANVDAYAVGLRREQSATRADVPIASVDGPRLKLAPLAAWTKQDVEAYTAEHALPRHPLYAQGYTSIGCDPCTRAVAPDADERAGRWWWEQDAAKECGLHFKPGGGMERTVDILLREVLRAPVRS